jgi:Rps23 Pro-64 3,4-dihydroxylase Tpa1-like proline 4-hydroxylase
MELCRRYVNVLGEQANQDLYLLALSKREHFTHSRTSPSQLYADWRRSTVIYDNQFADVAARLEKEIRLRLPEVMIALKIPEFDIGSFEIQLTSHNNGEYYKWHTDNGTRETEARVITFVYYFHGHPKAFDGGELLIHQSAGPVTIKPENDSMVFFNSRTKHEVKKVVCASRRFEDGRFTLNGWVRRKSPVLRDDYFGCQIFGPTAGPAHRVSYRPSAASASRLVAPHSIKGQQASTVERTPARPLDGGASQGALEPVHLLDLYSDLHRQSRRASTIDVLDRISKTDFFENYYYSNRPLILKGLAKDSGPVVTWSPTFFAQNYGSVSVQITAGRTRHPDYESNFRNTIQTITMAEFVRRLDEETNDFYIVARNYFFENPALMPLRKELQVLPEIINTADQGRGVVKLWFGPKGTVTPLHYDLHSILFMQIYGRKRVKLIPSFDTPKVYLQQRYYSAADPENVDSEKHPKFLQASVADVVVEPGDILFLPVGWWHWARSLDVSISATFSSFCVEGKNTSLRTT